MEIQAAVFVYVELQGKIKTAIMVAWLMSCSFLKLTNIANYIYIYIF